MYKSVELGTNFLDNRYTMPAHVIYMPNGEVIETNATLNIISQSCLADGMSTDELAELPPALADKAAAQRVVGEISMTQEGHNITSKIIFYFRKSGAGMGVMTPSIEGVPTDELLTLYRNVDERTAALASGRIAAKTAAGLLVVSAIAEDYQANSDIEIDPLLGELSCAGNIFRDKNYMTHYEFTGGVELGVSDPIEKGSFTGHQYSIVAKRETNHIDPSIQGGKVLMNLRLLEMGLKNYLNNI